MTDEEVAIGIYVLPTVEGMPPRAIVGPSSEEGIAGVMATWNQDSGTWMIEGTPVPDELAEAITEHAKSLGVEW